MLVVPQSPVPSQVTQISLGQQACTLRVYQRFYGLFMDLLVNNTLVVGGVMCLDRTRIVRSLYFGFEGDFAWVDVQGNLQPHYSGIGSRWFLAYVTADELPSGVG